MVLPEFSFCVFSSLVLSKVNLVLQLFWVNINNLTTWALESPVKWLVNSLSYCLLGDMLYWLENKVRLYQIILICFFLVLVVLYIEDWAGISSCFHLISKSDKNFKFGYGRNNGPATWKEHYESAAGSRQSPINILIGEAKSCPCGPLKWTNYNELPESMVMHNDGYSVTIGGKWTNEKPTLGGMPLGNETYIFNRLYFHWGPTDTEGSEHTLDYERFPLELHMIFLKDCYNNLMDAHYDKNSDGIVIVAFLFEITPVDNPGFLNTIIDNLNKVKMPNSRCYIQPFTLNDIYPEFEHGYYKYDGSITQPPCSEIVTYIIQSETIAVSKRQMSRFRKLLAFDGQPMVNNSRPVQKLNSRPVFYITS